MLIVLPIHFLNISPISNLYGILRFHFVYDKLCVIHFEFPPFDVFFNSFLNVIISTPK